MRLLHIACFSVLVGGCGGNGGAMTTNMPGGGGTDADGGTSGQTGPVGPGNPNYPPQQADLVWNENQKTGDDMWHVDFSAGDPAFNLYVRPLSVFAGDTVDVQVSNPAHADATWQVYRLGHYAGKGGRKLADGTTTVDKQPDPTIDPTTGMVECAWGKSFSVAVGADWVPGVYLARVQLADGSARFAPFIVRDRRAVDVLAVLPTNTDQAYNPYGGESLYLDTRFGLTAGHGYKVSFDRPFDLGGQGGYFLYSAMPTVEYLEANGYDVTYAADVDLDVDSSILPRARLVMALAHDEYWSRNMRDHYEAARAAGVSEAFLGANIGFWQVRFEAGADGMPNRRMVGYKEAAALDPLASSDPADVSAAFRGSVINRPENALLGVMSGDWHFADFPWRVNDASHWLYTGIGVQNGDLIPGARRARDRLHADERRAAVGPHHRRAVADGERRLRGHQRPGAGDGVRADRALVRLRRRVDPLRRDALGPARAGQGAAHRAQPDRARRRLAAGGGAGGHARRARRLGHARSVGRARVAAGGRRLRR